MPIILLSLLASLLLDIAPLPFNSAFTPEWTLLVAIYWTIALPARINVGIAWITGFFMDILKDTPIGLYALCMASASLFVFIFHQRMRYYPIWQQCLMILLISGFFQLFSIWLRGHVTAVGSVWVYFAMPLINTLCWPLVYYTLRSLRRSFQIR